jgi:hypothetical protein
MYDRESAAWERRRNEPEHHQLVGRTAAELTDSVAPPGPVADLGDAAGTVGSTVDSMVDDRDDEGRGPSPRTIALATVVGVASIWWVIYGRLTPFPAVWYTTPRSVDHRWEVAAYVVVTLALMVATRLAPRRRLIGRIGCLTWFVLTVWATQRGDGDGLWVFIVPLYVAPIVVMLGLVELTRWSSLHGGPKLAN